MVTLLYNTESPQHQFQGPRKAEPLRKPEPESGATKSKPESGATKLEPESGATNVRQNTPKRFPKSGATKPPKSGARKTPVKLTYRMRVKTLRAPL